MCFPHATVVLLLVARAQSLVAPRLPGSPFPVSRQPSEIWLYNLTGASFDERVLVKSAVGVVAQKEPILATVDSTKTSSRGSLAEPPGSDLKIIKKLKKKHARVWLPVFS